LTRQNAGGAAVAEIPKQRFKFRHANEIVGGFVLLAVLMLVVAVIGIAHSKTWLAATKRIIIRLPEASMGMSEGSSVEMEGMPLGIVDSIHVDELGKVTAEVTLKGDYVRFLRTDSVATVKRRFLLSGDTYIDISLGHGIELPNNAVITAVADEEPTKVITELRKNLEQSRMLLETVNSPKGDIQQMLANLNHISDTIARGDGLAGRMLTNSNTATDFDKLIPKVNDTLTEINGIAKDLRKTSTSLAELAAQEQQQLPAVMQDTQKTLDGIKLVLDDLQKTTAKLPDTVNSMNVLLTDVHKTTDKLPQVMTSVQTSVDGLPALLLQTQETMRQTQRLVEGIQNSFLVKSSMQADTSAGKRIRPEDLGGGQ
jgi:phospholipid/cholesterol/gamma-HCH transport system substrate-binding protein